MSARFSIIPARAIDDRQLKRAALHVLTALGIYADKNGCCYPSLQTIGKRLGVSHQAVIKQIKELERLCYIKVTREKRSDGGNAVNKYKILHDARVVTSEVARVATSEVARVVTSEVAQMNQLTPHSPTIGSNEPIVGASAPRNESKSSKAPEGRKEDSPLVVDLAGYLFKDGLGYLVNHGVPKDRARSLIGKWRGEFGDAALLGIMQRASKDRVEDPVEYITGASKRHRQAAERARTRGHGYSVL